MQNWVARFRNAPLNRTSHSCPWFWLLQNCRIAEPESEVCCRQLSPLVTNQAPVPELFSSHGLLDAPKERRASVSPPRANMGTAHRCIFQDI